MIILYLQYNTIQYLYSNQGSSRGNDNHAVIIISAVTTSNTEWRHIMFFIFIIIFHIRFTTRIVSMIREWFFFTFRLFVSQNSTNTASPIGYTLICFMAISKTFGTFELFGPWLRLAVMQNGYSIFPDYKRAG
jgi:hypothetical protein